MRPEDIVHEYRAKGLTLAPDGKTAVFSMQRPSLLGDTYIAHLWRLHLETSKLERLTRGPRDLMPSISPDGERVAFLRSIDGAMQIMVMPLSGGEAFPITDQQLGVSDLAWSPCSSRIAYVSRQAEPGRYGTARHRTPQEEPARLIGSVQYQIEGLGYSKDRPGFVFVVELPDLLPAFSIEEKDALGYSFDESAELHIQEIPDSQLIAGTNGSAEQPNDASSSNYLRVFYGSNADELVALREVSESMAFEMVALNASVGSTQSVGAKAPEIRVLVPGTSGLMIFSCAKLGRDWAFNAMDLGPSGVDMAGKNVSVYRFDLETSRTEKVTNTDEYDFGESYSVLREAGDQAVLGIIRERGASQLVRVSNGGEVVRLTSGAHEVKDIAAAAGVKVIVCADSNSADEIAVVRDHEVQVLTHFSEALRKSGLLKSQERELVRPDGTTVHGWVVLPEGAGPHPVLLNIHGGPHAQYTSALFDEAQVYASAGYAVLMCNPRGSAGYGEDFARSILHQMGTIDKEDVLDFLDHTLASTPQLDSARLGVMGGSYGGYLTALLLAGERKFLAGIVERGFLDPTTFSGVSDIGWFFRSLYLGDDEQNLLEQSPYAKVDRVSAPTLVIHSENDLRCPIEAAQRYFYELKRNGVESELLVFPGEGHELTRAGRPRHRVQRFQAILDWWQRYLPVKERA